MIKLTIDQLAFCLWFQKYLKNFFISRLKIFLIRFYPKNSEDLEKDIQHNMHFLKNWQKCKSGVVGTVLMDISKAYDCVLHGLLLAKLPAYGFDESVITLIANYISNKYQHVKIGFTFSSYLEILRGVPQG